MASMIPRSRPGITLLELLCSLAIMGVLLGMVAAPIARAGDVFAVRAAREAVINSAARARALAIGHGGATLTLSTPGGIIAIASRDGTVADTLIRLGPDLHVAMAFDDARLEQVELRFDGLGLGRLANRTVRLRRGRVTGGVTFSAYGRARPW
jgi:prepilin-type N-terminal cleavage/methylation domain-containing protein